MSSWLDWREFSVYEKDVKIHRVNDLKDFLDLVMYTHRSVS